MSQSIDILNIVGRLEPTTVAPTSTKIPKKYGEQFVLYVDSLTSPTVKRLYVYIPGKVKAWCYVALT